MCGHVYRSEFGSVIVERDESANGVRLSIRDQSSGRTIFMDPLALEALTWLKQDQLGALIDPSWRTEIEALESRRDCA